MFHIHESWKETEAKREGELERLAAIGAAFDEKFARGVAMSGTYQAARNLRKQGIPLDVAVLMLATRKPAQ